MASQGFIFSLIFWTSKELQGISNQNIVLFFSFNQKVDGSVIKMGKHLYEVKGSTQGQGISKSEVQAAADAILQPLMDLLDGNNKRIIFLSK